MKDPNKGKITTHGNGLGDFTEQDVEERAGEIAAIDGRSGGISDADRASARKELLGGQSAPEEDEDKILPAATRDPSEPMGLSGRRKPERKTEDEAGAAERLAAEGVDEAAHDQMLAARRRERNRDQE